MTEEDRLLDAMANGIYREAMYARSEVGWRKAQLAARAALRAYRKHCGGLLPELDLTDEQKQDAARYAMHAVAYPGAPQ